MTLETITEIFTKVQPARGEAWYVETLFKDRLFATQADNGSFGLFVRGELDEFGPLPRATSISHSVQVRIEPVGTSAPMLRVVAPQKAQGNRAVLYVACEATRLLEENPNLPNEDLLRRLMWMLVLLEDDAVILSPERQLGLLGELQLLARLIRRAKSLRMSSLRAIDHWHGFSPSKRDFSGSDIAIEVKATSDSARIHLISSLDQLEPQNSAEDVFLYSIGVRHDYSAQRRLKHYISDVAVLLSDNELDMFYAHLKEYGYDPGRPELYDSEPGVLPFHLQPCFFHEPMMVRLRKASFVGGKPPDPVLSIAYRLLLTGEPVSAAAEEALMDRLLS